MNKIIVLRKMISEHGIPVRYYLDGFNMNYFIGRRIVVKFEGYECLNCQKTEPIFRQGFCKKCFFESPQAGDWVMRPELSKAHLDIEDRDLAYEKKVQLQPHIVYLALSSHLKVGITRKSQVPTRWIDQGADQVMALLEVPNRYLAGVGEIALKEHFSDKTNWRKMLQGNNDIDIDLGKCFDLCENTIQSNAELNELLNPYIISKHDALSKLLIFDYPINQSRIKKVNSLNMSKKKIYNGILTGIKGQYLIFNNLDVLNIRSNEGLVLNITTI